MSVLIAMAWVVSSARAQSALDLIGGFDQQRLESCYPIENLRQAEDVAKLLYRLRTVDPAQLRERVYEGLDQLQVGDANPVEGVIEKLRRYRVPENLAPYLEMESFYEIRLAPRSDEAGLSRPSVTPSALFVPEISSHAAVGDRIESIGVVLANHQRAPVLACGQVSWFPAASDSAGWKLLADLGVDLSLVDTARQRDRHTLGAEDGNAFYGLLGAAEKLRQRAEAEEVVPAALPMDPIELLKDSGSHHGDWITMSVSTVRVTRVDVTDPGRQRQLGQDHYYQVDASGDLGDTIVELKRPEGEPGEPIRMSGIYPVSLVSVELPTEIRQPLETQGSVTAMIRQPVRIEGFYYRLWSYSSEFMTREGGGKQVAPLVVVADWEPLELAPLPEQQVAILGYILAAAIAAAIVGIFLWTRRNAAQDASARAAREPPARIDIPRQ
ncbi:hypothetical protein FYK55_13310 [Roseiconus nitratireducens]|uniref:Uncharacterized protein n=1 Tax=Roseiconus nitratireducens TaxID=2605748 RepID=A0A5M6DB37_9BACT|nr:hypothetical protein [Roseiconus nitratireducens]KAA5543249.1 hypothetical protein FYK55_13310 [Roseiconus nitratireducens]